MVTKVRRKVSILYRHVSLGPDGKAQWGDFNIARYKADTAANIKTVIDLAFRYAKNKQKGTIIYVATTGGEAIPIYQVKYGRDGSIFHAWKQGPVPSYWQRQVNALRKRR